MEEVLSLVKEPESQEEWATAPHIPYPSEEASEPEKIIRSGVMADTQSGYH